MKNKHYAFTILFSVCIIQAFSGGLIASTIGNFSIPICSNLNFTMGGFVLSQSFYAISLMITQIFAKPIYNRFDMKNIILLSGIVFFSCEFLLSYGTKESFWYVILTIQGTAAGFFYGTSCTLLLCKWFFKKLAFALSMYNVSYTLMGVIMNPIISKIIGVFGWRLCYKILAIVGAIFCAPFVLKIVDNPKKLGLLSYGADSFSINEKNSVSYRCKYNDKTTRIATVMILSSTICNCVGGYYQHLSAYASTIGLIMGSLLPSCELAGVTIAKFFIEPMLEKFKLIKTEMILYTISMIGFISYFFFSGPVIFVSTFFCGIYSATNSVLLPIYAREQLGDKKYQQVVLLLTSFSSAISTASNTLFGYLFDYYNSYVPMFLFCVVACTFSIIFILSVKILENR